MLAAPSNTWFAATPEWGWLIVTYFSLGALAGGAYFLAAVIDLFGRREDRPLARTGYLIALPLLVIVGIVLILDLSRPLRFWHLLVEIHTWRPMFKWWSPISVGTWAVLVFGFFSLLSFIGALADTRGWPLARRLRTPGALGAVITAVGALFALFVAGYTGVLLAVTNAPIWADTPLLGMLFIVSAIAIAAAALILLAGSSRRTLPGVAGLQRTYAWVLALQLLVLIAVFVTLGPVLQAWLNAWGLVLLVGGIFLGTIVPLLLYTKRGWLGRYNMVTAAVLVLAGGVILRIVIVYSPQVIG
jgi:protein NrfD